MMKKIYLTEQDIHQMIKESVQTLLLEALTPDEIYNKYYRDIDKNVFDAAIAADPTSYNPQGEIVKVGSYVKWILKLYQNGSWKPGDSVETKDLLGKFNKLKSKLPAEQRDIKIYSSVSELYNTLKPYLGIKSRREIKQKEATKVYEDEKWLIIIPHTEKAACHYGANTKWCTSAKEDNRFEYYNNHGPLYINIYKPENRKYQFHFKSKQFMKEDDTPIKPNDLPWTEGALAYYKSINKEFYFKFDWIGYFDNNGIAVVELDGKKNWFSLEKQEVLSPNQWFDKVDNNVKNGIARVELNGKWNWFSLEKQEVLSPNQWFDGVDYFYSNGIAVVKLNNKYTWFSLEKQGLLFPNKWFDWVGDFKDNGIARVKLNGKWNWFSLEKQDYLFPNLWFDRIDNFDSNGLASFELNGKCNFFSLEKQEVLFPNQWFDWVDFFDDNGIAHVQLNGQYYCFTLDGQLLDVETMKPLSQEQVQELFQQQQQIAEMVNRLVRNYLR